MKIEVQLQGLANAKARLAALTARLGNPRPLLLHAAGMVLDNAKANIETGGGDTPWAPTKFPSNKHHILIKSGALLNSLSLASAGSVIWNGDTEVKAGTNIRYAGYLQDGTRNMPARKFLTGGNSLGMKIRDYIAAKLQGGGE